MSNGEALLLTGAVLTFCETWSTAQTGKLDPIIAGLGIVLIVFGFVSP